MTTHQNRLLWADIARIISIFAVIFLHAAAHNFSRSFDGTMNPIWMACNINDSLVRWCVPVLVMLSGALLLPRTSAYDITKLPKRIATIAVPLFVWSLVFICRKHSLSFDSILNIFLKPQYYHLWFVYMLIGVYALMPFLKAIYDRLLNDKNLALYFLCVWLISSSIDIFVPSFKRITAVYFISHFFVFGGFFIIGAYLSTLPVPSKKNVILACVVLVFCLFFTATHVTWSSIEQGKIVKMAYHNLAPNTIIAAFCVFILCRAIPQKSEKINNFIEYLSDKTYLVYLMHPLILPKVYAKLTYFDGYLFSLRIWITAILTFVICTLIAMILRLIFKNRLWIG